MTLPTKTAKWTRRLPYNWNIVSVRWQLGIHPFKWNIHTFELTHRGRVTHICVSKLTISGSDHVIIWTRAGISTIITLGTNSNEILSQIHAFALSKMHFKMSYTELQQSYLGPNVLIRLGFGISTSQPGLLFVYLHLPGSSSSIGSWVVYEIRDSLEERYLLFFVFIRQMTDELLKRA